MKTATIRIYLMHGTFGEYCGDVLYRGKLLTSLMGKHQGDIAKCLKYWAINQGFTHCKIMRA